MIRVIRSLLDRIHRPCRTRARARADRTDYLLDRAEHAAEEARRSEIHLRQELIWACRDPDYVDEADIPHPVRVLLRRAHTTEAERARAAAEQAGL